MPLNEEEQRILEEIESHFYEEEVAQSREEPSVYSSKVSLAVPLGVLAAGALLVLVFFTSRLPVALGGFALMVGAATFLVQGLRARNNYRSRDVPKDNNTRANGFGFWPR